MTGGGISTQGLGYQVARAKRLFSGLLQPDQISTPRGQQAISTRLASPALQAAEIARYRGGDAQSEYLKKLLGVLAAGQSAR